jgi:EmrB/QacA subfamily drug resistance transporter
VARTKTSTPVLDPHLRKIATVVVLGAIMSILDTTIVAVALDTLGRDFKVSISTIQWVTTGYLLALAMVIPVTGWAVDRFGAKPTWLLSLGLFVVGSSLCGLAWSADSLIAFRFLQGIGGGMILPIGQSVLARAAGPQRMGRVMSVVGVPTVMGPVLGPVIGGLIVSNFSWRWIFYVNVPIGIVAIILSLRWLDGNETKINNPFDRFGFLTLSPSLVLLVYALSAVGTTGSFTSPQVLWSAGIGIVLMGAFVWHAVRARHPLLDLHLFRFRSYTVANINTFLFGATLYGSMFLLPLYYQVARGDSPLRAGLLMAPQGIGAALVMRSSGAITDRYGARRVVPLGIIIMVIATIPFTMVTTTSNELFLGFTLFVRGLGLGLSMMPIIAAAYQDLDHATIPKATTMLNIVRQVGGSVATALFAVVLQRQIEAQIPSAPAGLSLANTVRIPPAVDDKIATAFAHTFWWAVAIIAVSLIPTFFLPHHRPPAPETDPTGAPGAPTSADEGATDAYSDGAAQASPAVGNGDAGADLGTATGPGPAANGGAGPVTVARDDGQPDASADGSDLGEAVPPRH